MSTELRRRRRRDLTTSVISSLKRGSIAPAREVDEYDADSFSDHVMVETDENNVWSRFSNPLRFFRFDSLQFASTAWRHAQMLKCTHSNDAQRIKHVNDKKEKEHNCDAPTVQRISHFGSHVNFTPQFHYTKRELEPYRFVGDAELDDLLEYLASNGDCACGAFDDVFAYCANAYKLHNSREDTQYVHNDKLLQYPPPIQFYSHYTAPPPWVNFSQIQRGIDVFLAYLPAAGCALYYRSLVGGFSIPKIVEVLVATRYLVPGSMRRRDVTGDVEGSCHVREETKSNDQQGIENEQRCSEDDRKRTIERLLDTGGFMACCFAPPEDRDSTLPASSLRPGGKGWEAALRVRVLHAKVRRSLLQTATRTMGAWDVETNGIPINQEDMAATLLAFSVNVLLGIEFVAGKPLGVEDQRDYLALWRYLGWLLGVDTSEWERSSNPRKDGEALVPIDPCGPHKSSPGEHEYQAAVVKDPILHSYATLESMILHLLHPTKESRQLVSHLLSFNGRVRFRSKMCRKFLGDPLSDNLDIAQCPSGGMTTYLVYFFLMFLRCYTLLAMTFPRLQRILISWHGSLQRKFLLRWEADHTKRVGVAMGGAKKECSDLKGTCPFSMLMPPVGVHDK
ncbi:hypothetical protein HJC23_006300 [Cyclotella cryptica]|uniref:ER-bound oxygenase mpaB/mpaB'/Rubber oxygenase catalytic domain-containing protein n=1 Tax=Cyclotella cryptica TaxID=29204 RepID=A0ABD3PEL7_9STRA|eukprot:CCRYP_015793-RA/>CCRYP_015793-RA protein AED:0.20 eAED:0.20 QI:0/-1/0/1/-1/1/1/0/620